MPSPAAGVGYVLIGHMVGLVLLGFSLVQTWLYFNTFRRDPWMMKVLVVVLTCADLANSICGCQVLYEWLVTNFANPSALALMLPGFLGATESEAITAYICQMFFAWRVQRLRKQWWLTLIIVFFGTAGVLAATGVVIGCGMLNTFDQLYKVQPVVLVWSCTVVMCDVITTATLIYTLRHAISGFNKDTDTRVERIKNLILHTSALLLVIDLIHLLIVAIKPNDMLHLCFNSFVGRIYSNALLSTLNTRTPDARLIGHSSTPMTSLQNTNRTWSQDDSKTAWDARSPTSRLNRLPSLSYGRMPPYQPSHDFTTSQCAVQVTTVQEQFVDTKHQPDSTSQNGVTTPVASLGAASSTALHPVGPSTSDDDKEWAIRRPSSIQVSKEYLHDGQTTDTSRPSDSGLHDA